MAEPYSAARITRFRESLLLGENESACHRAGVDSPADRRAFKLSKAPPRFAAALKSGLSRFPLSHEY
jgi:hypothetical protein